MFADDDDDFDDGDVEEEDEDVEMVEEITDSKNKTKINGHKSNGHHHRSNKRLSTKGKLTERTLKTKLDLNSCNYDRYRYIPILSY